jgi:hypothetical protein
MQGRPETRQRFTVRCDPTRPQCVVGGGLRSGRDRGIRVALSARPAQVTDLNGLLMTSERVRRVICGPGAHPEGRSPIGLGQRQRERRAANVHNRAPLWAAREEESAAPAASANGARRLAGEGGLDHAAKPQIDSHRLAAGGHARLWTGGLKWTAARRRPRRPRAAHAAPGRAATTAARPARARLRPRAGGAPRQAGPRQARAPRLHPQQAQL